MAHIFGASSESNNQQSTTVGQHIVDISEQNFQEYVDRSRQIPVIVYFWATWSEPSAQLGTILEQIASQKSGSIVVTRVNADENPNLVQAFQTQSVPSAFALIGAQVMPLFSGTQPQEQVTQVIDQVIEVAKSQGIEGQTTLSDTNADQEPAAPVLSEDHQAAEDALAAGDFETAMTAFQRALDNNPKDEYAETGLARVALLNRLGTQDPNEIRQSAADNPKNIEAQLQVADLDMAGGHVEDAYLRLLDLFPISGDDDKNVIRQRLVDFFAIVGQSDPRTISARQTLANLLY